MSSPLKEAAHDAAHRATPRYKSRSLNGVGRKRDQQDPPKRRQRGRVLHHAVTVNIRGNSYRLKDKLKAGIVQAQEAVS